MNTATPTEEDALLKHLQQLSPSKQQAIFSVIPRLLVSDQLLPDRWYQYQLMRYSQLADIVRITASFALTQELRRTEANIPAKFWTNTAAVISKATALTWACLSLPQTTDR